MIQVCKDYLSMSSYVADEIIQLVNEQPDSLVSLAAGFTSLGVFDRLVHACQKNEVSFSKAFFVGMDEWIGMDYKTEGSCGDLLFQRFLSLVNFPRDHIFLINGLCEDLKQECSALGNFLKESPRGCIDYVLLGCGMNGHLALNEPGTPVSIGPHVTCLDEITKTVGQKYFSKGAELTGGITLGLRDFRESRRAVLAVSGSKKSDVLFNAATADLPLPASLLFSMSNASVVCDYEAAAKFRQLRPELLEYIA